MTNPVPEGFKNLLHFVVNSAASSSCSSPKPINALELKLISPIYLEIMNFFCERERDPMLENILEPSGSTTLCLCVQFQAVMSFWAVGKVFIPEF